MDNLKFDPAPEAEYAFEKPEAKRLAEKMVRISEKGYSWKDFLGFAEEFRKLVDSYGPRDKDLHKGMFQTLDKVRDRTWSAAFGLLVHVLLHPGTSTSFWDNPVAYEWARAFLEPDEVAGAIQDLKKRLQA